MREVECSSSNGHGTAESLAKLFGILADGGEYKGKRLLSRDTINKLRRPLVSGYCKTYGFDTMFSVGFMNTGVIEEGEVCIIHRCWFGLLVYYILGTVFERTGLIIFKHKAIQNACRICYAEVGRLSPLFLGVIAHTMQLDFFDSLNQPLAIFITVENEITKYALNCGNSLLSQR